MRLRVVGAASVVAAVLLAGVSAPAADKPVVRLATTAALEETGLLAWLLPKFSADSGVDVQVHAVDAKRAFELGKRGDADVLLVEIASRGFLRRPAPRPPA
jgi:tungstate transport system substrate-binding protein